MQCSRKHHPGRHLHPAESNNGRRVDSQQKLAGGRRPPVPDRVAVRLLIALDLRVPTDFFVDGACHCGIEPFEICRLGNDQHTAHF